MPREPKGEWVTCPDCETEAVAVLPPDGVLVRDEGDADGKVWSTAGSAASGSSLYFRTDG